VGRPTIVGNDFGVASEAATAEAACEQGVEEGDDELP
jgi:hypothetical protein